MILLLGPPKMGVKWTNRRLLYINVEYSNPQIYTGVTPKGIYILTGNQVISYFRSAANCVHVVPLPSQTSPSQNDLIGKSQKLLELATSKFSARYMIASIIDDSRSAISVNAFRTAQQMCGLSCFAD